MNTVNRIKSLFYPEQYQGWGRKRKYFEGWYFKVLNRERSRAFAFIPGIAMDLNGRKHLFIQVLDGIHKKSQYHSYDGDAHRQNLKNIVEFIKSDEISLNNSVALIHREKSSMVQGALFLGYRDPCPNQEKYPRDADWVWAWKMYLEAAILA